MKRSVAALAVLLTLVPLSACSAITKTWVPQIKVGECTSAMTTDTEVSKIPKVACDKPHEWEVYASSVAKGESFPGNDVLGSQAEEFCLAQYQPFVGIEYDDSTLEVNYLTPTEKSWVLGDRDLTCLIGPGTGTVTGSLKGSQK